MAQKKQYTWADGYRASVSAQVAGERLAELERKHGHLTAPDVVEDARPEESPIHPCFEWDNYEAAERYREGQARRMVTSCRAVYVDENGDQKPCRSYLNVQPEKAERCYMSTAKIVSDHELHEQVLAQAFRELQAFRRRYQEISELQEVFHAMDRVVRKQAKQPRAKPTHAGASQ